MKTVEIVKRTKVKKIDLDKADVLFRRIIATRDYFTFYSLTSYLKNNKGGRFLAHNGWLYFLDKNYFLEESNYLNGKLPGKISS